MSERDFWLWGSYAAFFAGLAIEMLLLKGRASRSRPPGEERA